MSEVGAKLADLRVVLSIPLGLPVVPVQTALSLALTTASAAASGLDLRLATSHSTYFGIARSHLVHQFLQTDATHFFMVDADMVWTPDDFKRLVVLGTKMPVVGATYPMKDDSGRFIVPGLQSTPNEFGCLPVAGLGLGFTVVQREVLERLSAELPTVLTTASAKPVKLIFRTETDPTGNVVSEDINFFRDVARVGYQPYLDPWINLGHVGPKEYRVDVAERLGLRK